MLNDDASCPVRHIAVPRVLQEWIEIVFSDIPTNIQIAPVIDKI